MLGGGPPGSDVRVAKDVDMNDICFPEGLYRANGISRTVLQRFGTRM